MSDSFLERNKKKGLLAALLLFLRGRKTLVVLLLLMLTASMVFLSPSSWIARLPGGAQLQAGVAWLAQQVGVDVSDWGLGGRHSFGDLSAFFANQKANAGKVAGWGAFLTRVDRDPHAIRGDSLDLVRGRLSDLQAPKGAIKDEKRSTIAGVITPEQAGADPNADAVAISPEDLGGERESWVKSAFAGGFMNGLLGGTGGGPGGSGTLSGGAYAGQGFFNGKGGATTTSNALAHNGLSGVGGIAVPRSKIQGAAKGSLSAARSRALDLRAISGSAGASSLGGNRAFTQLAQGRGLAAMATAPNCTPPGCPGEYAATNTGIIYDGTNLDNPGGIIIAPDVDGYQVPNIPGTGMAQQYADQAAQMERDARKCADLDAQYGPSETRYNQQMQSISDQFASAGCGSGGCSRSKARYCRGLGDQLKATCNQYMTVRCAHTHACPLTATANCSNECDAGGNGTGAAESRTIESNTDGNTDGSGMSSHPSDGG